MIKNRNQFPERTAKERVKDFKEVCLPFSLELAVSEAQRCLQCKTAPCITGCPVGIQIPNFISELKKGNVKEAYQILRKDQFLPSVCGRVCPQEVQCESKCVLAKNGKAVAIGKLERFIGDFSLENNLNKASKVASKGKKVAVVGSGPSSLACAGELAKNGVEVTVFEALHKVGGVLIYGIPEFRLPKAIIAKEINVLKEMGVTFLTDHIVGKTISIKELKAQYDAVFIGVGAGFPSFLEIPGEKLNGVFSSNEFLTRINLMNAYQFPEYDTPFIKAKEAVIIGGGNTAMDSARTALRMGVGKVTIAYRRTEEEMPARKEEVHHAKEEGVEMHYLVAPVKILGNAQGKVEKMVFQKMKLGEIDQKGKRSPVPIEGEFEEISADMVVIAVGTQSNPLLSDENKDLKVNKRGYIEVDGEGQTSIPKVYAGGDIVTGSATVIQALGAGKRAAMSILKSF